MLKAVTSNEISIVNSKNEKSKHVGSEAGNEKLVLQENSQLEKVKLLYQ